MRKALLLLLLCRRFATKIALTTSFGLTAALAFSVPEWGPYLLAVGFVQNYVWIWET